MSAQPSRTDATSVEHAGPVYRYEHEHQIEGGEYLAALDRDDPPAQSQDDLTGALPEFPDSAYPDDAEPLPFEMRDRLERADAEQLNDAPAVPARSFAGTTTVQVTWERPDEQIDDVEHHGPNAANVVAYLRDVEQQLAEVTADRDELRQVYGELDRAHQGLTADRDELAQLAERHRDDVAAKIERLQAVERERDAAAAELAETHRRRAAASEAAQVAEAARATLADALRERQDLLNAERANLETLADELATVTADRDRLDRELSSIGSTVAQLERERAHAGAIADEQKAALRVLIGELRQAWRDLDAEQEALAQLRHAAHMASRHAAHMASADVHGQQLASANVVDDDLRRQLVIELRLIAARIREGGAGYQTADKVDGVAVALDNGREVTLTEGGDGS